MYDRLVEAIRPIDNDHLIFFEGATIDLSHTEPGFTEVPGGAIYNNRSVYSYHIYCAYTDSVRYSLSRCANLPDWRTRQPSAVRGLG
jgi:hypothetical protein